MNEHKLIFKIIQLGAFGFFLEIFIALLLLMWNGKRRKKLFWILLPLFFIAGFGFYYLPSLTFGGFNYMYLIVVITVGLLSLALYKEKPVALFFATATAFGLQHLSWNVLGFVYDIVPNVENLSTAWIRTIQYFVFALIYGATGFMMWKYKIRFEWQKGQVWSFLISSVMILVSAVLSQLVDSWSWVLRIYTVLLVLLAASLEFVYPQIYELAQKKKALEDERTNLESLLALQAHQQDLSKQEQEILNLKFHDMKNQIAVIRGLHGSERLESLDELEKSVDVYGAYAKTGNDTIDIIVTQKSLLCSNKGIRFNYIIDGKSFEGFSSTDVTSLFGNLIDNAIEAVEDEEGEYRLIKLMAFKKNGFLSIYQENYSHKDVTFENGRPVSTKKDKDYHGFGTRSIQYIVEKYHGTFTMSKEDDVFSVSILLPSEEIVTK